MRFLSKIVGRCRCGVWTLDGVVSVVIMVMRSGVERKFKERLRRHYFNPNCMDNIFCPGAREAGGQAELWCVGIHRENPTVLSAHSSLCPVTALRTLFTRYPKSSQFPLFTRSYGQSFSKSFLVLKMQELLLNVGISTVGYSGHSLRKGPAVTADRNGISKHDIKLLGRWKSDAIDVYINEHQKLDHI